MRAPFELGCRPERSSSTPAFASSSLYLPISPMSVSSGMTPASESLLALTIIRNRISLSSDRTTNGASRNRQPRGETSAAGHRADDEKWLGAGRDGFRQQRVRHLIREVLLAGEEADERP